MAYTIASAKSDLEGILHGTSVNKVTNITNLFNRAARQFLEDCDPQETKRKSQIASALFDEIYDYSAPTDLKGNKVIDIRPQVNRGLNDNFSQTYSAQFDLYKERTDNSIQVAFNQGVKTIRIKKAITGLIAINENDSTTANGTWAGTDDATNLTSDSLVYVSGSGSVNFDVSGATTTATLTNSTFADIDLTDHDEQSVLFAWMYFPDSSTITSVQLRWGNDSSNYWASTNTAAFSGAFQNGWNQIDFDWNGATETGTVDPAAIDYLQVIVTYDGAADTDLRLDSVSSNLGNIYDIVYYSKYLFANSSGTWQEETSDDTDTVNLDTESFNVYLYKVAEMASQQIEQLKDDTNYFKKEYMSALRRYKNMYKSEVMKPRNFYYRV